MLHRYHTVSFLLNAQRISFPKALMDRTVEPPWPAAFDQTVITHATVVSSGTEHPAHIIRSAFRWVFPSCKFTATRETHTSIMRTSRARSKRTPPPSPVSSRTLPCRLGCRGGGSLHSRVQPGFFAEFWGGREGREQRAVDCNRECTVRGQAMNGNYPSAYAQTGPSRLVVSCHVISCHGSWS